MEPENQYASVGGRRFIESANFPLQLVNEASAKEKRGGGTPPHWEMVFWWTRKPLTSTRAVIAGSLLPEMPDPGRFMYYLGARSEGGAIKNAIHNVNPTIPPSWKPYFQGKTLLDPFACFGSIPLEGLRLGLSKVVAVDLLPVAYIFLKAVLDYPARYSSQLISDVEKWGNWVTERLKEDPDVKEMYDEDVAVYIGTWEVRCPSCNRYTPLVGDWWLARVKDPKGGWKALAWMTAKSEFDRVNIEVMNLNKVYGNDVLKKAIIKKHERRLGNSKLLTYTIRAGNREWRVEEPNIATRVSYAKCLLCRNPIIADEETVTKLADNIANLFKQLGIPASPSRSLILALLQHGTKKALNDFLASNPNLKTSLKGRKSRVEKALGELIEREVEEKWYVKQALNEWNRKLEEYLEEKIGIEELKRCEARPTLLVKVKIKDRDPSFEPAIDEDYKRLWGALEKLRQIWGNPDIPIETLPLYEVRDVWIIAYGFDKWYKLFNPRQLLALVKLVKLIREAGRRIEEEKLREGKTPEEAYEYAEAVTTYLAIALTRFVIHNNTATSLDPSNPMGIKIRYALAMRSLGMRWNWGDINPVIITRGVLRTDSWVKCVEKEIDGLKYLVFAFLGDNKSSFFAPSSEKVERISILLDDAAVLSKLSSDEKFDLIVTDPPYRDDVLYTELSDFYYVWLKRALSDVEDGRLKPKFHAAPFNCFFKDGREVRTQWEEYRLKEISLNPRRLGERASLKDGLYHYRSLMAQAFLTMYERLKDDGVLVTYFAHTDPEAWAELIEAGWRFAGFTVTNALPIVTESATSIIKRGKLSLDTSIAVVWRKPEGSKPIADIREIKDLMLREGLDWARKVLGRYYGRDLFFTTFARILSVATRYSRLTDMMGELDASRLVKEYITPLTGRALVSAIGEASSGEAVIKDPLAQFYLLVKILFAIRDGGEKAPRRKTVKKNDMVLLTLAVGIGKEEPTRSRLIYKPQDSSEEYILLEPLTEDLEEFLRRRGIDPIRLEVMDRPTSAVDLLHMMEYVARRRGNPSAVFNELGDRYPNQYSTAIALAKALIAALPEGDVEKRLCHSLLLYIGG